MFGVSSVLRAVRTPHSTGFASRRFLSTAAHQPASRWGLRALIAGSTVAATVVVGLEVGQAKEPSAVVDYDKVRECIEEIIDADPDMGPTFVRLAWHSSGTWDEKQLTGGSNGATMRFAPESEFGANAGLHIARDALEPVKKKHPGISYGDLWTLAGTTVIEEFGGPKIAWKSGRVDKEDGSSCPKDGTLPDADKGSPAATIQHVRDIFYRMGFNDREIVALLGAHALGRCHPEASGYWGPWTRAPTTFSNEYYRELLTNTWTLKKWNGPAQYEDPTGELMMLHVDMALIWDPEFKNRSCVCRINVRGQSSSGGWWHTKEPLSSVMLGLLKFNHSGIQRDARVLYLFIEASEEHFY
eukprot:CFRG6562T1